MKTPCVTFLISILFIMFTISPIFGEEDNLTTMQVLNILNTTKNFQESDLSGLSIFPLDFERCNLHKANLERTFLFIAQFDDANLEGASLRDMLFTERDILEKSGQIEKIDLNLESINTSNIKETADRHEDQLLNLLLLMDVNHEIGVSFRNADLRASSLNKAILVVASFKNANLKKANFDNSVLLFADFRKADLQGANLNNINMGIAYFDEANLKEAILTNVDLHQISMIKANLEGADLRNTRLARTNFTEANLTKAVIRARFLQKTIFNNSILREADLEGSGIIAGCYCDFRNADLTMANLMKTTLHNANFQDACLKGANLKQADLQKANFKGANLQEANLSGANLRKVIFDGADLQGANLLYVENITIKQLRTAHTLYQTKLPDKLVNRMHKKYPHLFKVEK
ncbi:pentapeptide repeat-containing protein [Thermodesulfobacteriota bacterium]